VFLGDALIGQNMTMAHLAAFGCKSCGHA